MKVGTLSVEHATKNIDVKVFNREFLACWDTGAMGTVVVPEVVSTASLIRRGTMDSVGIDGVVKKRPTYHAAVVLPCGSGVVQLGTEMTAVESNSQLNDIQMLIGMHVMKRGRTLIERDAEGRLMFEFRPLQPQADDKPKNSKHAQRERKQTHGSRARHPTKKTSGKRRRR